eukprot:TRINITY_DN31985_c0_g1_i1.p1 TRINITY_DN31985_c0_g1~~TRINITY_DN31985_c0_g1_i1.p1  ORF type:complete len:299 (-),score=33.26 TRINITY_DN31985_c0_g1_i1:159-1055(-)
MPREYGPAMSFALGGMSGSFACLLSNPFEVVKTRFQLQGELACGTKPYKSMRHAFLSILKTEGIAGVQRGLSAGVSFQLLFNGVRIGLFDHVKRTIHSDAFPNGSRLLAGATTGCMAAACASPLFLVKARLQAQTSTCSLAVGAQHGYTGMFDGLRKLHREAGVRGLYRGVDGFVWRTAVGSAFQLGSFDMLKVPCQDMFGQWNGTLLASATAGLVATTAMNPLDVVATRLYNQPYCSNGIGQLYSGPLDCIAKSFKAEGPAFMTKGFLAHASRLVPHSVYCLVFFEKVKQLAEYVGL